MSYVNTGNASESTKSKIVNLFCILFSGHVKRNSCCVDEPKEV
eukprot:SAG11_NODE_6101_length_1388_cov_1.236618_2_plen_43_part_00